MIVREMDVRDIVRSVVLFRPARFTLLLTTLAVLGAALVLSRQVAYGVGLGWDSINYLSVARNLLAGEGFVQDTFVETTDGSLDYTMWAPLYPLLLALSGFRMFDPWDIAGPLNAVFFGLTVFVAGRWLRRRIHSQFIVLSACLAVMLSIPLTRSASYAMSETTFILFATLSLIRIDGFLIGGKRTDLLWAAVFTSLACLTRYIGLTVIAAALPLLLLYPGVALLQRVKHCAAYVSISLVPIGLWMLRNILLSGGPTGPKPPSNDTLPEILSATLADLSRWVLFWLPSDPVRIAASALAAIVLLVLTVAVWRAFFCWRQGSSQQWSSFCLFGGFALLYLVVLVAAQTVTLGEPAGGRYLYPVYIPLLFAGVFALDRFLVSERSEALRGKTIDLPILRTFLRGRKPISLLTAILILASSLWLLAHAPRHARDIWLANGDLGQGFASSKWIDSEVLGYMRDASIESPRVVSSVPVAILYATGVREYVYLSQELDAARRKIASSSDGGHVVWFHTHTEGYEYGVADLRGLSELEVVADLSDGVVFRIVEGGR